MLQPILGPTNDRSLNEDELYLNRSMIEDELSSRAVDWVNWSINENSKYTYQ